MLFALRPRLQLLRLELLSFSFQVLDLVLEGFLLLQLRLLGGNLELGDLLRHFVSFLFQCSEFMLLNTLVRQEVHLLLFQLLDSVQQVLSLPFPAVLFLRQLIFSQGQLLFKLLHFLIELSLLLLVDRLGGQLVELLRHLPPILVLADSGFHLSLRSNLQALPKLEGEHWKNKTNGGTPFLRHANCCDFRLPLYRNAEAIVRNGGQDISFSCLLEDDKNEIERRAVRLHQTIP